MDDNNFFSIDRLVEFGMGMAMAQQMVHMMNETMQSMYVPGSASTIQSPMSISIYVGIDGQSVGPLSESEFSKLVIEKKISCSTLVWIPGMLGWKPLEQVPNLLKIVAMTPPPLPTDLK